MDTTNAELADGSCEIWIGNTTQAIYAQLTHTGANIDFINMRLLFTRQGGATTHSNYRTDAQVGDAAFSNPPSGFIGYGKNKRKNAIGVRTMTQAAFDALTQDSQKKGVIITVG